MILNKKIFDKKKRFKIKKENDNTVWEEYVNFIEDIKKKNIYSFSVDIIKFEKEKFL